MKKKKRNKQRFEYKPNYKGLTRQTDDQKSYAQKMTPVMQQLVRQKMYEKTGVDLFRIMEECSWKEE